MQRLRETVSGTSIEELTLLLSELLRLENEVKNAVNPRYTFELGLLRTSFVKGMTSVEHILKMIDGSGQQNYVRESSSATTATSGNKNKKEKTGESEGASAGKAPDPSGGGKKSRSAQPDIDPGSPTTKEEDLWRKLLEHLESRDNLLACKLGEAKLIGLTATELTIGFNGGMSVLADSIKKNTSVIESILTELSGHKIRLKTASLPPKEARKDIDKIKKEVFAEPIVQDAMRIFKGSMIKVKPLENDKGNESA